VSLAGGQAEIAPGANPGSKIRGFGSSKHLDEGHQSRARASLRAGTSRLTERGEKGSKNDEMTRDESRGHPSRPRPRRESHRPGRRGRCVFARLRAQVPREYDSRDSGDSRTQIFNHTRFKQSARFTGENEKVRGREREARQTIEPVKKRNRFHSFLDLEFLSATGLLLVYIILPKRKIALRNPNVYPVNALHFFYVTNRNQRWKIEY